MKNQAVALAMAGGVVLLLGVWSPADVSAQPEWHDFWGNVTFNGQPAPIGSVIDAYDPDSVHCGTWTVGVTNPDHPAGVYGLMPVYGDDNTTDTIDEGADLDDTISFKVNGKEAVAEGNVVWRGMGAADYVALSATGNVAVTGVVYPTLQVGAPGDTVRFWVGVQNIGDGLDFYGISATPDTSGSDAWSIVNQDSLSYADQNDTVFLYFDAIIAPFAPGDTVFHIGYSVFSYLDTSQHVDSAVDLVKSISDVDDEPFAELPDAFRLNQNYPNPFNPTTTISFTLSSRSSVSLKVFNVLGQQVHSRDLGVLRPGDHSVEYRANGQPSGIYFYRLVTETGSQTRKMILLR